MGHKGINPKETYIISVTSKPLTFPKSAINYVVAQPKKYNSGNRYITNNPEEIAMLIKALKTSTFKNIIIDDFNYLMQDYYMDNALKGGWDRMCVPA